MTEIETRKYKISAKKEELDILDALFHTIESMGILGASRAIKLDVDGDGAFHPHFEKEDENGEYHRVETNLIGKDSPDTVIHGYGVIGKECDEWHDGVFYIFYDFG